MRYFLPLVMTPLILLGLGGALFTWNKLEKMKQIRGWKPGAETRTHVIRSVWSDPRSNSKACWVTWTDQDVRTPGNHRLHLPPEIAADYRVGDEIEVVYVPGDPSPYHRDGVYANDGNFEFDYGLLVVECVIAAAGVGGAGLILLLVYLRQKPVRQSRRRGGRSTRQGWD